MSRKGNCWDNSPIESFWGRLKVACVHGQRFATREQARQAIMNWMAFCQLAQIAFQLGLSQPYAIRETLVRGTAQKSRVNRELRTPQNRGNIIAEQSAEQLGFEWPKASKKSETLITGSPPHHAKGFRPANAGEPCAPSLEHPARQSQCRLFPELFLRTAGAWSEVFIIRPGSARHSWSSH